MVRPYQLPAQEIERMAEALETDQRRTASNIEPWSGVRERPALAVTFAAEVAAVRQVWRWRLCDLAVRTGRVHHLVIMTEVAM